MKRRPSSTVRRLVVPAVLAVTVTAAIVAAAGSITACGDDLPPPVDGSIHDAPIDTPIV